MTGNAQTCLTPESVTPKSFSKVRCILKGRQALTSKFMEMGGRAHFFLSLVGSSSISALIWDSFIPAIRFILLEKAQKSESARVYSSLHRSIKQTLLPQGLPLHYPSPSMLSYFQTMAFSLALYFAFPFMQMTCTPLVLRGVGIRTWKAQSGEQGQGDCSLGTLGSLSQSVLDPLGLLSPSSGPREHQPSQGILG